MGLLSQKQHVEGLIQQQKQLENGDLSLCTSRCSQPIHHKQACLWNPIFITGWSKLYAAIGLCHSKLLLVKRLDLLQGFVESVNKQKGKQKKIDQQMNENLRVSKHPTYMPHTAGRYQAKRFRKAQCPIVERLTNSLMHGRNNGKKLMDVRIIKHAIEIIHLLTGQSPVQVIVDVVINSGPREDAIRIGSAGVVRRQAVGFSHLRHVNQALYFLSTGAHESAFRNKLLQSALLMS